MKKKRNGNPDFYKLLSIIEIIYSAKNEDYAKGNPLGNFYRCEKGGVDAVSGIYARLTDKDSRVDNLMLNRNKGIKSKVKESLPKTLLDKAVYSLLMILLLKKSDNFELECLLNETQEEKEKSNAK